MIKWFWLNTIYTYQSKTKTRGRVSPKLFFFLFHFKKNIVVDKVVKLDHINQRSFSMHKLPYGMQQVASHMREDVQKPHIAKFRKKKLLLYNMSVKFRLSSKQKWKTSNWCWRQPFTQCKHASKYTSHNWCHSSTCGDHNCYTMF